MSNSATSRLRSTFRQLGWKEGLFYLFGRALTQLSGKQIRHIRYHFVAQPVAETANKPLPPGGRTQIGFITAQDPVVSQFPRPEPVISRRFEQGDRCLVSRTDERFTGFIWLASGQYEEDTVRCLYRLAEPDCCVWDYDVYVEPEFRMGRTFSRLWSEANRTLSAAGVQWSCSRIDVANPQSLDAHRRLGIRHLFTASFFRYRRWQLMIAGRHPFIHLSGNSADRPVLDIRAPEPKVAAKTKS